MILLKRVEFGKVAWNVKEKLDFKGSVSEMKLSQ